MSKTRQQVQHELFMILARIAELTEQLIVARAMLRALDLQAAEPADEPKAD